MNYWIIGQLFMSLEQKLNDKLHFEVPWKHTKTHIASPLYYQDGYTRVIVHMIQASQPEEGHRVTGLIAHDFNQSGGKKLIA
jgi:hypothetical protein